MAFEARAEDRETRGFISITRRRPVSGSTANCTFDPPVATPMARSTSIPSSRISWYSLSERVWIGATVIESPVWTPMASRFSIEQITTALSAWSLITSNSNSFHPSTDSSTRISETGDASKPLRATSSNCRASWAIPVPPPPRM